MLTVSSIAAYDDNYIWLLQPEGGDQAFVVDPGDPVPVLARLEAEQLELAGILITHHHFDHVGGVKALRERYQPRVYGPANPAIEGIDVVVGAGAQVDVLGTPFEVLEVPGHTLDHIAYYDAQTPQLFCGDTLFAGGCGRVFEGTAAMMHASLQRLAALPPATRVYCAHEYTLANLAFARAVEPNNAALSARLVQAEARRSAGAATVPSLLADELATNPFLRCDAPSVLATLQSQGRLEGGDAAAVFATLRGWKDHF